MLQTWIEKKVLPFHQQKTARPLFGSYGPKPSARNQTQYQRKDAGWWWIHLISGNPKIIPHSPISSNIIRETDLQKKLRSRTYLKEACVYIIRTILSRFRGYMYSVGFNRDYIDISVFCSVTSFSGWHNTKVFGFETSYKLKKIYLENIYYNFAFKGIVLFSHLQKIKHGF